MDLLKGFQNRKENMDRRILELAIAELERQKTEVEEKIEAIRAEFKTTGVAQTPRAFAVQTGRSRTAAQRKAQSEKMRNVWEARRQKTANKLDHPDPKAKKNSQAISAAMKAHWAKRKTAKAKKK
jgi:hypothetical protein